MFQAFFLCKIAVNSLKSPSIFCWFKDDFFFSVLLRFFVRLSETYKLPILKTERERLGAFRWETFERFVCDRSQCEMKGTIRIGSGHNFGMPSGMNKIMGTATVQRQGIFQSLAFTYWFCDYRSMRFRNTTHTTLFCQSPDQIKIFSL